MLNFRSEPIFEQVRDLGLSGHQEYKYDGQLSRTIMSNRKSSWDNHLRTELANLCNLDKGWDGYGSPAVKFENAEIALNFLSSFRQRTEKVNVAISRMLPNVPYLVPISGGAVQAEWHFDNMFVELFFDGDQPISAIFYSETSDLEEECTFDPLVEQIDISPLLTWFKIIYDIQNVAKQAA